MEAVRGDGENAVGDWGRGGMDQGEKVMGERGSIEPRGWMGNGPDEGPSVAGSGRECGLLIGKGAFLGASLPFSYGSVQLGAPLLLRGRGARWGRDAHAREAATGTGRQT